MYLIFDALAARVCDAELPVDRGRILVDLVQVYEEGDDLVFGVGQGVEHDDELVAALHIQRKRLGLTSVILTFVIAPQVAIYIHRVLVAS